MVLGFFFPNHCVFFGFKSGNGEEGKWYFWCFRPQAMIYMFWRGWDDARKRHTDSAITEHILHINAMHGGALTSSCRQKATEQVRRSNKNRRNTPMCQCPLTQIRTKRQKLGLTYNVWKLKKDDKMTWASCSPVVIVIIVKKRTLFRNGCPELCVHNFQNGSYFCTHGRIIRGPDEVQNPVKLWSRLANCYLSRFVLVMPPYHKMPQSHRFSFCDVGQRNVGSAFCHRIAHGQDSRPRRATRKMEWPNAMGNKKWMSFKEHQSIALKHDATQWTYKVLFRNTAKMSHQQYAFQRDGQRKKIV